MRQKRTFDEIRDSVKVTGICKVCTKKCTRTVSDYQTLNPYNKNKNGQPKSAFEIRKEVEKSVSEKADKLRQHFICATCFSNLSWSEKMAEERKIK
jgi:hypothetical protein